MGDWGSSLQTDPRGQLIDMRPQYKECVSEEGTPYVVMGTPGV